MLMSAVKVDVKFVTNNVTTLMEVIGALADLAMSCLRMEVHVQVRISGR